MEQNRADSGDRIAADRARLAAIVDSSDDAIISKTLDGMIETWNGGARRIFGFTADEAVGKHITLIIPGDRLDEETQILEQLRAGFRVDHLETVRQTKSGQRIDVSVTSSPVRDQTGKIVGVSKVARDITQQKQFEKQLQLARQLAEDASRAKDDFLSILSHELRTPLTPVLAAANLLAEDPALPESLAEHVAMIRRNVEMEARLVDDLLDLTRIARGKIRLYPEVIDTHSLLRQIAGMFDFQIKQKDLELTMSLNACQSHVLADAARFQQMVINLLSNAIKFTPARGSIILGTSCDDGQLNIEVIDTGMGIEPEMLARLFRPFEQAEQATARRFGGLGLGLSIVKSLAELHHGTVSAFSDGAGKGAKLTITLPTVPPELSPAKPMGKPMAKPSASLRSTRVLLVEDHEDTRRVMARVLIHGGCSVTVAASVKEAIEAADQHPFDVLLSDLGLPDGSGNQVMQHVAVKLKIPGIALSGFGQESDLLRSREAGFARHLIKPVSLQSLLRNIAELTSHHP